MPRQKNLGIDEKCRNFCPINGKVGEEARIEWENNPHLVPGYVAGKKEEWDEDDKATARGAAGIGGLFLGLTTVTLKTYTATQRTRLQMHIHG